MRKVTFDLLEKVKDANGIVITEYEYVGSNEVHVYVLNFFNVKEVEEKRYDFSDAKSHSRARIVARVIGSVKNRVVYVPDFMNYERELAVLWFMWCKENGMVEVVR